jgi:glucose/arabinose dehydrogenase
LEKAFSSLSFSRLTNLVQAGDRLFVTEQVGRVMSFPSTFEPAESAISLDIRSRVSTAGNEEGLLGLVFDPKFNANGHFYVYYSAAGPHWSAASRFTQRDGVAVPENKLVVFQVPQPFSNHNGGQHAVGPEGMLYISLGDGGAGCDPQGNGQNRSDLLGNISRIDVSGLTPDQGYLVPPDNPFAGSTDARGEIRAYGLRNLLGDSHSTGRMATSGPETKVRTVLKRWIWSSKVETTAGTRWKAVIASPHEPDATHLAHYSR